MTVEELIKILQQQDPKAEAVVRGYEGGFKDITAVKDLTLVPHFYNDSWMGPYEGLDIVKYLYTETSDTTVLGVVLY